MACSFEFQTGLTTHCYGAYRRNVSLSSAKPLDNATVVRDRPLPRHKPLNRELSVDLPTRKLRSEPRLSQQDSAFRGETGTEIYYAAYTRQLGVVITAATCVCSGSDITMAATRVVNSAESAHSRAAAIGP